MDKGLGYPTLLRGSASRKSNNPFTSPILSGSGYGVRPGHQKYPAQARRIYESQKHFPIL